MSVTLREITEDNFQAVVGLRIKEGQRVAPNVYSLAQAYVSEYAWTRAVCIDGTPVGFVMLYDNPDKPEYFLWRFMIDAQHQGKGYGSSAIELVKEYVRTRPHARHLLTSSAPTREGGAEDFYRKLGFTPTGDMEDDEVVLRIDLQAHPAKTI